MVIEEEKKESAKELDAVGKAGVFCDTQILRTILEQNNAMLKEILEISRKTKSHLFAQNVIAVVKIFIFLVPIALSIIFLPPLIKEVMKPYQELLDAGEKSGAKPFSADFLKDYLK